MQPNTIHNSITHDVLAKIQHKEISVHSKTFFRFKLAALVLLVAAVCVISIILCSFILFTLRMTGQPGFIGFGSQGILLFFVLFPWTLFFFDLLLIGLSGLLMRHISFGYRVPGIYVVGIVFTVIIVSGYVIEAKTAFHKNMLFRADKKQLPFFHGAYMNVRKAPPEGYGIYRGVVILREGDTLFIDLDDASGLSTSSSITLDIRNDPRAPHIEVGDSIFISGKKVDGKIQDPQLKRAPRLPQEH
ncbi:MAG: hypothetical protein V4686_03150 [Patescibacteria group bacterium]